MVKTKTSLKPRKSSKNISQNKPKKLKPIPYSPTKEILEGSLIGDAILECLKNNDPEGVVEMLSIYFNTVKRVTSAKKPATSPARIHQVLKKEGVVIKALAQLISTTSPDVGMKRQ
jgi:hypothetical protein